MNEDDLCDLLKLALQDELPPPPKPPPMPRWVSDVSLLHKLIDIQGRHIALLNQYAQYQKDRLQIFEMINRRLDREGMFFMCNLLTRLKQAEAKARAA